MKIETLTPLTLKRHGASERFDVGSVIDLPNDVALKLCDRASGKVWPLPADESWLSQWEAIATVTGGIMQEDPRRQPILDIVERLDGDFKLNDRSRFQRTLIELRDAVKGQNL